MTAGPLPPHERAWRHPSELAGPQPEPPTRVGRFLILATATFSLVLLGALAIQFAPRRGGSQEALVASTLVAFGSPLVAVATAEPPTETRPVRAPAPPGASVAAASAPPALALVGRPVAAARRAFGFASERGAAGPGEILGARGVMVTPLAGGLAITTSAALDGSTGPISATVPSGETVVAEVLDAAGEIAVMVIVGSRPADTVVVADNPATGGLYLAVGGLMVPVQASTLAAAAPPEGAPVVDASGALVALCTYGPDGVELVLVGARAAGGADGWAPSPVPATTVR